MGNVCASHRDNVTVLSTHRLHFRKRHFSDKLDQVYPSISQYYDQNFFIDNNKSHLADMETIPTSKDEIKPSLRQVSPPKYDQKEIGIGAYYLKEELDEQKYQNIMKKKRKSVLKASVKWQKASNHKKTQFMTDAYDEVELYNREDISLKHYALWHPRSFRKMIVSGPPMEYRWSLWKLLLKPHRYYIKGLYERFKGLTTCWDRQIKKDLHRTFPEEPYFTADEYHQLGQEQLFNVLKALSLYFPNIGYTQGMNFYAGLLLLVNGGNELQAFWMSVALMKDPRFLLMGMFDREFPVLDFYIFVFLELLESKLPKVYHHLKQEQLPNELWLFRWFLTLFVQTLPSKQVIRVWDFILRNGMLGMVKVALGILKVLEKDLLSLDTFGMDSLLKQLRGKKKSSRKGSLETIDKENKENIQPNRSNSMKNFVKLSLRKVVPLSQKSSAPLSERNSENLTPNKEEPQQYTPQFREIDIDEVLAYASRVPLGVRQTKYFVKLYEEKSEKKLREPYKKILSNLSASMKFPEKFRDSQEELRYYIMKSELCERVKGDEDEDGYIEDGESVYRLNSEFHMLEN